jgi:hypothetical protein
MDAMGLTKYNVYGDNIRVSEQMETQMLAQQAQEEVAVNAMTPVEGQAPAQVEEYGEPEDQTA